VVVEIAFKPLGWMEKGRKNRVCLRNKRNRHQHTSEKQRKKKSITISLTVVGATGLWKEDQRGGQQKKKQYLY